MSLFLMIWGLKVLLVSVPTFSQYWISQSYDVGSGLQVAYACLDSIRAVKNSLNFTGLSPDPIITLYGYSGGGYAGSWVSLMAFFF
jgi:hypothetical protein